MLMNFFVDTEFTCFETATQELISLGIVSENGEHQFYRENTSHNADFRSDYVNKVIMPLLEGGNIAKAYPWVCLDLRDWISSLPCDEVCFVVDFVGDWHLLKPMIEAHPQTKKVSCMMYSAAFLHRLRELGVHTESKIDDAYRALMYSPDDEGYYATVDPRQHHALVDAKANRHAWLRGLKAGLE